MVHIIRCFHCGEELSEYYYCESCRQIFCKLHIDLIVHECNLNKEFQNNRLLDNFLINDRLNLTEKLNQIDDVVPNNSNLMEFKKKNPLEKVIGASLLTIFSLFFTGLSLESPSYLLFNLFSLLNNHYWKLLTSLFVVSSKGAIELIFFVFNLIIVFQILIWVENRFNSKFIILLYFFCCFFSCLIYTIIRLIVAFILPIGVYDFYYYSMGFSWAGFLGIVIFRVLSDREKKWDILLFYAPIKLEGLYILILLMLLRILPILYYLYDDSVFFLLLVFELVGILGGVVFYCMNRFIKSLRHS